MIIKYINPVLNAPQVTKISDAYISKGVDENGNETDEWVLMANSLDNYQNSILIEGESFSNLCEFINELYDNKKLDLSSNVNIKVSVYPRNFQDIINVLDLENEDLYSEDFTDDFLDEEFYND